MQIIQSLKQTQIFCSSVAQTLPNSLNWHCKDKFSHQFHKKTSENYFNLDAAIRCIFIVAAGCPIDKKFRPSGRQSRIILDFLISFET